MRPAPRYLEGTKPANQDNLSVLLVIAVRDLDKPPSPFICGEEMMEFRPPVTEVPRLCNRL